MRVYRATYRNRRGTLKEAARWYVEFKDGDEEIQRLPALTDRAASGELGRKIEALVARRIARQGPDADLTRWIEELPDRIRDRLVELGILDASRASAARTLSTLLDEFQAALRTRERTPKWIRLLVTRLRTTFTSCRFVTLSDLDPAAIERHLHELRSAPPRVPADERDDDEHEGPRVSRISARESNHRLQACREFSRWAVHRGLLASDPLATLRPVNAKLEPERVRRALRPEEVSRLLQAAHEGPVHRGVSGPVRALAWRLAAQAGLRIGEVQALQVRDLDLDGPAGPTIVIRAAVSKNRTEARLPLALDLAEDLAPLLRGKLPTASVLGLPSCFKDKATRWLRFDLERTGEGELKAIPYEDESGRVADVHSLRSSFVASLVRSGANVKAVQSLARHSSPSMTLGIYARLDARDEREAIAALPGFRPSRPELDAARATGTDGGSVLPSGLPERAGIESTSVEAGGGRNPAATRSEPIAAVEVVEAAGIEPASRPGAGSTQARGEQAGSAGTDENPAARLAALLAVLDPEAPDLALVVRSWPSLPAPLRAAVLALVRASTPEGKG